MREIQEGGEVGVGVGVHVHVSCRRRAAASLEEPRGEVGLLPRERLVCDDDAHHLALVRLLQLAADKELVQDVVGCAERARAQEGAASG